VEELLLQAVERLEAEQAVRDMLVDMENIQEFIQEVVEVEQVALEVRRQRLEQE